MHKLRALAPLLVGLTFVFLAPTAQADCPHKGTNFDHQHCVGVEPPSIPAHKRVFLSTVATFNVNLGGVVGYPFITDKQGGAHWLCNLLAQNAGLPGTYKAWLSDAQHSPASGFIRSSVPYLTPDGTMIALDYDDLTSGVLENAIAVNESGEQVTTDLDVWTGTAIDGSGTGDDCSDWIDGGIDKIGGIGSASSTTSTWTDDGTLTCDQQLRLYCFEQ